MKLIELNDGTLLNLEAITHAKIDKADLGDRSIVVKGIHLIFFGSHSLYIENVEDINKIQRHLFRKMISFSLVIYLCLMSLLIGILAAVIFLK